MLRIRGKRSDHVAWQINLREKFRERHSPTFLYFNNSSVVILWVSHYLEKEMKMLCEKHFLHIQHDEGPAKSYPELRVTERGRERVFAERESFAQANNNNKSLCTHPPTHQYHRKVWELSLRGLLAAWEHFNCVRRKDIPIQSGGRDIIL